MDSSLPYFLETGIFLTLAIVVFDRIRQLVLYGVTTRDVSLLICSIAIFALVGSVLNSSYTRNSKAAQADDLPMEITLPSQKQASAAEVKEQSTKSFARLNFIHKGAFLDYVSANGETLAYVPTQRDIEARASKLAKVSAKQKSDYMLKVKSQVWWLAWIPVFLLGYACARFEHSRLVRDHNFSRQNKRLSFGEIEGFVGLLMTACEQSETYSTLEVILSLPDEKRQALLRTLIADLREKSAPKELTDAFLCLMDDEVAEKVYVHIHKCTRRPMEALALR